MMTHRERLRKALNHEETDRVPIDIGGSLDTTLNEQAYKNLKKYIGQPEEKYEYAIFWENAVYPDEKLQKFLDVDVRAVHLPDRSSSIKIHNNPDGSQWYKDEFGIVRKRPVKGLYFDLVEAPIKGELTKKKVEDFNWPKPDPMQLKKDIGEAVERAKYLYEETDYGILASLNIAPATITQIVRGFSEWSMDIMDKPDLVVALMEGYIDVNLEILVEFYKGVGKYCDVAYFLADDLAIQNGLWLSPDIYRKYVKKQHKRVIDTIRKYTDAKVMFHCCGAASDLLPDFIENGMDIFNPVQVNAKGMDSKKLKREFGKDITFWGGIDTQRIMPFGSPEDVRREVFQRISDLTEGGGGYVMTAVHNILPDVPPENILAMVEAGKEWSYK